MYDGCKRIPSPFTERRNEKLGITPEKNISR